MTDLVLETAVLQPGRVLFGEKIRVAFLHLVEFLLGLVRFCDRSDKLSEMFERQSRTALASLGPERE